MAALWLRINAGLLFLVLAALISVIGMLALRAEAARSIRRLHPSRPMP